MISVRMLCLGSNQDCTFTVCFLICTTYVVAEVNLDIMKKYRTLNYDYHNVGWYQSTHLGSHVDKNFLENQLSYQSTLEESVVLVYGQWRHEGVVVRRCCIDIFFNQPYNLF